MYNKVNRNPDYLAKLSAHVFQTYGITAERIKPARRGYFGETWRLDAQQGSYFLKLDYSPHRFLFANSISVISYMNAQGINYISSVRSALDGALYSTWDEAALGVFHWIEGENADDESAMLAMYQMLSNIYTLPVDGLNIRRETFDKVSADLFYRQWERLLSDNHDVSARICRLFDGHKDLFAHRYARLKLFCARCAHHAHHSDDNIHMFITHGDAGGNVIKLSNGQGYALVDWDDPVLAPPERDAWMFMSKQSSLNDFIDAMQSAGISYEFNPDRLAFYCYSMFFYYLTEYLAAYFVLRDAGQDWAETLCTYFTCWIENVVRIADGIL